ncbi:MAG: FCD domain-containing protein [Alphaproteobacteria bacterium]|nr:FCD domain-containing protein [Alphaproteobacteria bacterium]
MMEALGELEAVLARLATQRIDSQKREELMTSLQQTQQAADNNAVPIYIEANARLHEVIYRASGNPYLVNQTKLVRLRISGYRRQLFAAPGRLIQSQQEHRLVVEAILAGHANEAYDLMRAHISAGGQAFADLILTNEF